MYDARVGTVVRDELPNWKIVVEGLQLTLQTTEGTSAGNLLIGLESPQKYVLVNMKKGPKLGKRVHLQYNLEGDTMRVRGATLTPEAAPPDFGIKPGLRWIVNFQRTPPDRTKP